MAEKATRKERRGIKALANLTPRQHGSFAQIQPQKATAAKMPMAQLSDKVKPRPLDSWIADAYTYADEIGEVGFVVNLQANLGSRCLWVPQEYDPQTQEWVDTENETVLKAMASFQGPQGGQMELRRRAFLHMAIAGESLLLGSPTEEPDIPTGVVWEFLSSQEIKIGMNGKAVRYPDGPGMESQSIDPTGTYMARMWRSHPQFSSLSDSPLRRCLTIANEILYLTRSIAAAVRSRLAAGILLVPDEADFTASNQEDEDLVEAETDVGDHDIPQIRSVDELGLIIARHLRAPIEDPLAPGSIIPLVVSLKKELIEFIKLLDLAKAIDPQSQELLTDALARLPRALDVDPGILDGKANASHWNGWLVDDDLVQKHVIPAGELIVEFVTVGYLRPALENLFGMPMEQARLFKLVLDPSPIQARSDAAVSARVLFEEGVLKVESLLRANGFDPSDMPDDQEWIRQFARKMLLRSPALGPVLGVVAGFPPDLDWSAAIPATGGGGPLASSPVGISGAPTKKVAPTSETSGLGRPDGAVVENIETFRTLVTQVATSADAAIDRAFELAGARFASHAKKDATLRDRIAGIDRGQVLTAVAPSDLERLGVSHEVLFDGAWKALNQRVKVWVRDYEQIVRGASPLIADELGAMAASNLCNSLTLFVLDHRHSVPGRQRNGLAIPDELVLEALHSAGVI